MEPSGSDVPGQKAEDPSISLAPPRPLGGLKRMQGTARLRPAICVPTDEELPTRSSSLLSHSASIASFPLGIGPSSSNSATRPMESLVAKPRSNLSRTKTSIGPLIYRYTEEELCESNEERLKNDPKVTPMKQRVPRTPGTTFSNMTTPKSATREAPNDDVTPPAALRRSSSGSMLLRQTPKKTKRYLDDLEALKPIQRSESLTRLTPKKDAPEESQRTPVIKRKRTSSLTSIPSMFDDMPVLTPQKRAGRPRANSECRTEEMTSPVKRPMGSPLKKRVRNDSGSRPASPLKKRYVSTVMIRFGGGEDEPPATPQSLQRNKSSASVRSLLSERIAQTYGTERRPQQLAKIPETMGQTSSKRSVPPLVMRSTSGDSYYSVSEGDEQAGAPGTSSSLSEVQFVPAENQMFVTPRNSLQEEEMVPLVKKQMSIDEKIMEDDDDDEGFGDSTKTIKKGQGAALARSLSLKLSPRKDQQKPIGADTEKSCSTPSLPTAPLLRQGSASSLRFKVSPSTFLKSFNISPVTASPPATTTTTTPVSPLPPTPLVVSDHMTPTRSVVTDELSEPSTSKTMETATTPEKTTISRKSSLKKTPTQFVVREDQLVPGSRRRSVRYEGLKVYYFDRKQGDTTVPTEGEVSLDMHDKHHAQRYFPLSTGKRPKLDLVLYSDEDLSDGEVITPDSDDEEQEYEEYASAKSIHRIVEKIRMRLLKKSGIQADKSGDEAKNLRVVRHQCGCSCKDGICIPETCQCAIDGIECQVDGGDDPTHPCVCYIDKCANPNGRIFYDQDAVRDHRTRAIMNHRAAQKTGFTGSPTVKKFVDSDDEDQNGKSQSWLLQKAIPTKLEESPMKYPVTPVYTRRSRSSLSDIRESTSETSCIPAPSASLAERMKLVQHLENEACVEEEEEDTQKNDTISLQEVFDDLNPDEVVVDDVEPEIIETAMSPVKATLVV